MAHLAAQAASPRRALAIFALVVTAASLLRVSFVLAGDGPQRETLEAQARDLGLADRVYFLGHRIDVPELLACCDLFGKF